MALRMHLVYTSLALIRPGPQVLAAILERANSWVLSFLLTASLWAFHDNFLSSQIPRNLAEATGLTVLQSTPCELCSFTALGHCVLPLLKCMSSDFSAANTIPLVSAHWRQVFHASCSWRLLASGLLPKASKLVSAANPTRPMCGCFSLMTSYREAMYKMNSMGDSGEPWGTPALTGIGGVAFPSKWSVASLSVSHAFVQRTIQPGNPISRRVWRRRM